MADSVTKHGFTWGPMEVSRICEDNTSGRVLRVETSNEVLELRVPKKPPWQLAPPDQISTSSA